MLSFLFNNKCVHAGVYDTLTGGTAMAVTSAAFRLILVHKSSSGISVWLQAGGVATSRGCGN